MKININKRIIATSLATLVLLTGCTSTPKVENTEIGRNQTELPQETKDNLEKMVEKDKAQENKVKEDVIKKERTTEETIALDKSLQFPIRDKELWDAYLKTGALNTASLEIFEMGKEVIGRDYTDVILHSIKDDTDKPLKLKDILKNKDMKKQTIVIFVMHYCPPCHQLLDSIKEEQSLVKEGKLDATILDKYNIIFVHNLPKDKRKDMLEVLKKNYSSLDIEVYDLPENMQEYSAYFTPTIMYLNKEDKVTDFIMTTKTEDISAIADWVNR